MKSSVKLGVVSFGVPGKRNDTDSVAQRKGGNCIECTWTGNLADGSEKRLRATEMERKFVMEMNGDDRSNGEAL